MFDLEDEVRKWRQGMMAAGLADPAVIQELEEHLREDVAQLAQAGASESDAFGRAVERLGGPKSLRREFDLISPTTVVGVLRAHQGRILLCAAAGLLAAMGYSALRPTLFISQAKLFVRRLPAEPVPAVSGASGASVTSAAQPHEQDLDSVMDRERQLLTSRDLAARVAERIGPSTILRTAGGGDDLARAADLIRGGLTVTVPRGGAVITIAFRHPAKELLQPVGREVIQQYLQMHVARARAAHTPAFAASRTSNISVIQNPSPPRRDAANAQLPWVLLGLAGLLAGIGWAFALDWRFHYPERPHRGLG